MENRSHLSHDVNLEISAGDNSSPRLQPDASEGVQVFTGTSVRVALNKVKKALGSDAIILEQKNIGSQVIVRACTELPESPRQVDIGAANKSSLLEKRQQSKPAEESSIGGSDVEVERDIARSANPRVNATKDSPQSDAAEQAIIVGEPPQADTMPGKEMLGAVNSPRTETLGKGGYRDDRREAGEAGGAGGAG